MELVSRMVSIREIDHVKTGAKFKKFRLAAGISVELAANGANMSAAYLYALEQGKRAWNDSLLHDLVKSVENKGAKPSVKKSSKK